MPDSVSAATDAERRSWRRETLNALTDFDTAGARATLWRTLQTFNVSRIVIVGLLLAYFSMVGTRGLALDAPVPYLQLCSVYFVASIAFVALTARSRERFLLQLTVQIAVDIVMIASLYLTAGGPRGNLAILFLFPLAGGAILAPLILALFFSAVVSLVLLTEGVLQSLSTVSDTAISTAGLYGMAFFSTVLVLNQLASKLIKQETLASQRGQALRLQTAINRLVIADMGDGILVVDRESTVVIGNPAAEAMLGLTFTDEHISLRLAEIPTLAPIAAAFFTWLEESENEADGNTLCSEFVVLRAQDESVVPTVRTPWTSGRRGLSAHLKLRFAKVVTADIQQDRSIIFLQDVSEIENRAQDLKLASMGRLTASIAHEVRNPLSAISYAASLLEEEAPDPTQTRLLRIIEENVTRLNQMIEDILKLSRKAQPHGAPLLLASFLREVVDEFNATQSLSPRMVALSESGQHAVRFDPLHLREVVLNLLSNAVRYGSGVDASIRLDVIPAARERIELHVMDDGAPISADVRAHLFEPFYTTSSKGTGLGLYLARELCLNNEATLDYEYRLDAADSANTVPRGRFVITCAAAVAA